MICSSLVPTNFSSKIVGVDHKLSCMPTSNHTIHLVEAANGGLKPTPLPMAHPSHVSARSSGRKPTRLNAQQQRGFIVQKDPLSGVKTP